MFELLLLTMTVVPPGTPVINSSAIETGLSREECLAISTAFQPRQIQLPSGHRLTFKLACEKADENHEARPADDHR